MKRYLVVLLLCVAHGVIGQSLSELYHGALLKIKSVSTVTSRPDSNLQSVLELDAIAFKDDQLMGYNRDGTIKFIEEIYTVVCYDGNNYIVRGVGNKSLSFKTGVDIIYNLTLYINGRAYSLKL